MITKKELLSKIDGLRSDLKTEELYRTSLHEEYTVKLWNRVDSLEKETKAIATTTAHTFGKADKKLEQLSSQVAAINEVIDDVYLRLDLLAEKVGYYFDVKPAEDEESVLVKIEKDDTDTGRKD